MAATAATANPAAPAHTAGVSPVDLRSNRVAWCQACQANVRDVPVVAVLVGLQASGKTTFCRDVLGERYVQVSKDHFPNARNRQQRQLRPVREALAC
jgi:hypothetical protein